MAVFVMLEFKDDAEAHTFVKETLENGIWFPMTDIPGEPSGLERNKNATVRAVWKKPTIFCDKNDGHLNMKKKTEQGFTRGQKYGWWVCRVCGKPSKLWAAGNAWNTALGMNLLPQSELAPEYRPPHFTSPEPWNSLETLLNPSGPWDFHNDPQTESLREMVRKKMGVESNLGPLYKGVVRQNDL